eukprot:XP_001946028.2 PREDICTED: tubulin polyglutamylase TTLL6-like isoform X1 [Acyrthosiphon pisum]
MEKKCSIQQLPEENEIQKKGAICLQNCTYSIVHEVATTMGMHIVKPDESWDLWWCNVPMDFKKAKNLKKYQKTNHFLGMSEICRKDSLARNLNTMSNSFPDDYNFYPMTWYLPSDYIKFQTYMNQHKSAAYILKPTTGSQGTGIYITKSPKKINQYKQMICQLYISKPLLLDGYKFDMRLYTLIASCDPLKIYVYNDGLVRLATEPYETPTYDNVNDRFMHLTNYSVNKCNKMYIDNELFGSKRRITALGDWLHTEGYDVKKIWNEIDDVIIKTMILAYPFVNRSYQTCFSDHKYTPPCFEILGFDILLDENCKPYLLEVNHSPDFHTDTSIDKIVKRELLIDTFKLLQLDKTLKKFVSAENKWKIQQQTIKTDKNVYKQRMLKCKEHFEQQNNVWQSKNMGNYRLVFSEKNAHLYEHFYYCNESAIYRHKCRTSLHQESEK